MRAQVLSLAALLAIAATTAPRAALAAAPPAELMERLAGYAVRFETVRTHASYAVSGQYETLDGDGKADCIKKMVARVDPDGETPRLTVVSYTEDGKDKTDEARKDARERAEKQRTARDKKRFRIPILAEEQPRYDFDQVQVDAADPTRVRISFTPKVRASDTIEGSAWVDTRTGTLISAGFKLSKTPIFVDFVHFTVQFGQTTELGPAVSTVFVEGKGGILFFRKHFQATAMLSDYRFAP
jgi:hypothetical protein